MKVRILLLLTAFLFLGGGTISIFASDFATANGQITSPTVAAAGIGVYAKSLTQDQHLMILIRMGLFYAGFICVLLAFDLGMDKGESSENEKPNAI